MSKNEKDDGNEFTFIKERILPKKKSRFKKICLSFGATIVLAVVFGMIARVAFIMSEPLINRILGIDADKKTVTFDKGAEEELKNGAVDVDKVNGESTEAVKNNDTDKETESADTKEDNSKTITNYVEKKIPATANDFTTMYADLRKIANNASKGLVKVISTVVTTDVLHNPYEVRKEIPGLVVASNQIQFLILVDYQAVKDATSLTVSFVGEVTVEATLQDYDKNTNLAILSVRLNDLSVHTIEETEICALGESYLLSIGTPVIAIGASNGIYDTIDFGWVTNCSTNMYVTDLKLDLFYTSITASCNGLGYIVNLDGKVVGIITNAFREKGTEAISTAIGISRVKSLIEKMINDEDRIYIGIIPEDMPADQLLEAGLNFGIYVSEVISKSPAYEAGIQNGDIIASIDGNPVAGVNSFVSGLSRLEYKDEIEIEVVRFNQENAKHYNLTLTVGRVKTK